MRNKEISEMKKRIRPGLIEYMENKDPGKSYSTYSTYASDSNYLLNNGEEDAFIRFVRSENDDPAIKALIERLLIEHRGAEEVTDGGAYYYEKLCLQRDYIKSIGGIDSILSGDMHADNDCFLIDAPFDEKVQEIAIKLIEHILKENDLITYSDLARRLSFEINPRNIERQLGVVSFACKDNGLPPISVMVVNKETLMPGDGFFKAYFPELKSQDERWKKCFELMNEVKVYGYWANVRDAFVNWQ